MSNLEEQIKKFTKQGLSAEDVKCIINSEEPPLSFQLIAKDILCGYFEVQSGTEIVKIAPTSVEMYYHEDDGDIKDSIVYHKNTEQIPNRPLFEIGFLHDHYSGIDITFEFAHDGKKCRASALIRGFRVIDGKSDDVLEIKNPDNRSTYFRKALLGQFSVFEGFSIKWKDSPISATNEDLHFSKRIGMDKRQDNADENSEAERKWNFSLNMKDEYTNTVYISQWFGDEKEGHPRFYEELKQLFKKAGIHFEELSKDNKITNDYWVRDFMPIQLSDDYFVKYKYHPDYLKDKYKHTITNSYYACKDLGIRYKETNIILDGGNVVQCGDDIILTDKVFSENNCDKGDKTLLKALHDVFGGRNIIIIPWTPSSTNDPDSGEDVYGHADGFVKYIGDKHILMSAHRMEHPQEAKEIVDVLKKYNYKVDEMDFSSVPHPHYDLNWAYINFLQVGRIIIMPKFNIEEDEIARKIIQNLFSNCTICQIEMTEIVKEGGALHCLTWNVKR